MIQTVPNHTGKETDPYLAEFERFENEPGRKQPSWVYPIRKAGISRFAELGFPTLKHEDWRFTNVSAITRLPFKPVFDYAPDRLSAKMLNQFNFVRIKSSRLVFVNGHFSKALSLVLPQKQGVTVGSLAAAVNAGSADVQKHLAHYARSDTNAFAALNNAFFTDGA